jgi:two-component system C4-dicarboxylate transport sensor histidine kinase DctB
MAVGLYAGRISSLGIRVGVDDARAPASIHADAEQLARALKNVVQNAIDAMEQVADRALSVTVRGEGARVVFEIRDSGPGFDAASLARVFEPYFTTRAESGGTGLGMAIAQRIVAEHGGTIRAGNAEGGGAVVTIVL